MNASFEQSLQRQLDIVSAILLGSLNILARPRLILEDAETASTDGAIWVRMPNSFLGEKLNARADLAAGLLAHEIGHWLQPVKDISEVEKETGLMHSVVNILLDVHGENLVASIFPLFNNGMRAVRTVTKAEMLDKYIEGIKGAKEFAVIAINAMLYMRYGEPSYPSAPNIPSQLSKVLIDQRIRDLLLNDMRVIAELPPDDLPDFFRQFASTYPELCQASDSPNLPFDPMSGATQSGGSALPLVSKTNGKLAGDGIGSGLVTSLDMPSKHYGKVTLSPTVLELSRKLTIRWSTPRGATTIMAPGRFNRLGALRDDPVPFTMPVKAETRQGETIKLALILDWSGSMDGNRWRIALEAAQAIALSVRNNGGDVRVIFFAENAWHAPDYSGDALFAKSCGIDLEAARGDDTDLRWLPVAWHALPYHRFVILTDGRAYVPNAVPNSSRQRTSALLIQPSDEEVFRLASMVASSVQTVNNLTDLASVWATLIPRRWVA